ncbi:hypothetical protein EG329_003777 [Mollisiaceae sp. DMI_Dod_QoI]|nr:hypothetical protein EG329_003777 [Helotiales sp. DMI_Dod_QoI]
MEWLRELDRSCTITVIGKDFKDFQMALRTWDWSRLREDMRLLIVVKGHERQEIDSMTPSLMRWIDVHNVWTRASDVPPRDYASAEPARLCVIFTARNLRIDLNLAWTEGLLESSVSKPAANETVVRNSSLNVMHGRTWYINIHETIAKLETSPLSHNTLSGMVGILRMHGEEDKFLLSSAGYKGWTYIASRNGVAIS